ncbi:MAG: hypothetical protein LBH87_02100 [Coriobacteriales bacterium]|nr:hypothetical protein [Coriobacteriales bacterium]
MGGKRLRRRIGRVLRAVFFPGSYKLAGYLVKRREILFMFKRKDRFFAADSFQVVDGRVVVDYTRDSWDSSACKRIGLNWDKALILENMSVFSADGTRIGWVSAVEYDEKNCESQNLMLSTGTGSKALVGLTRVPMTSVASIEGASIILSRGFVLPEAEGGLAAKAGTQAAIIGNVVSEKAQAVGASVSKVTGGMSDKAGKTVKYVARRTGQQINDSRGMFKSFKDEYQKAAGPKKVSAASKASGLNSAGGSGKSSGSSQASGSGKSAASGKSQKQGMFSAFKDEYQKAAGSKPKKKS